MQKIRLGHSSLFCVCVCHCHAHSIAVFSECVLNVFFLLCLRSAKKKQLFLMSQMSNVNGIEQRAPLQRTAKRRFDLKNNWHLLACLHAGLATVGKKMWYQKNELIQ